MGRRVLIVGLLMLVFGAGSPASADDSVAQPGEAPLPVSTSALDGTWQGVITFDKEAFLNDKATPAAGFTYRFEIHDLVIRVFYVDDGVLGEVKPGAFHISPAMTNAVIYATDGAANAWVETWAFVVTKKDDNTLMVQFARAVNNTLLAPSEDQARYETRGSGEFKRVTP